MKKIVSLSIVILVFFSFINVDALTMLKKREYTGGSTKDIYENGFVDTTKSDNNFKCETILIKANGEATEFKKILDGFFGIMQFLAPVIAIVLTIIDYMKSMSNGDTKKANKRTIIRVFIAVLVVFLPLLLDLLFHLFGLYDISTCNIGR